MTPSPREAGGGETGARLQDALLDAALHLIAVLVQDGTLPQAQARQAIEAHLTGLLPTDAARRLGEHFAELCRRPEPLEDAAARTRAAASEVQRLYLLLKVLELTRTSDASPAAFTARIGPLLALRGDDVAMLQAAVENSAPPPAANPSRIRLLRVTSEAMPGALVLPIPGLAATFLTLGHAVCVRRDGSLPVELGGRELPAAVFFRMGEREAVRFAGRTITMADLRFHFRQAARPEPPGDLFLAVAARETLVHRQIPPDPTVRISFREVAPSLEWLGAPHEHCELNGAPAHAGTPVLLADHLRVRDRPIDLRKLAASHVSDRHTFSNDGDTATIANDPDATFHFPDADERPWTARLVRRDDALQFESETCPHPALLRGNPISPGTALQPEEVLSLAGHELAFHRRPDGSIEAIAAAPGLARVCVEEVSHRFPEGTPALDRISLEFERGDMVCILGPSGCGKSTLLAVLCGALRPSAGTVTLDGADVQTNPAVQTRIGFVPQDDLLQENLTVAENLRFAARLRCQGESAAGLDRRMERTLRETDLTARRSIKAGSPTMKSLSGGQRKRLNIGLELVGDSHLLLLDEPTSGLSAGDALKVVEVLAHRAQAGGIVVAVVHQPSAGIFALFQRVVVLDQTGRMAFDGPVAACLEYFAQAAPPAARARALTGDPGIIFAALEQPRLSIDGSPLPLRRYPPAYWQDRFGLLGAHHSPLRAAEESARPVPRPRRTPWARTALVLLQREALNKLRGHSALAIQFGSTVILGLAAAFACRAGVPPYAYSRNSALANYLFLTVIACLFLAISGSVQEIIRDRALLLRERLLRIPFGAYLLSKFAPLLGLYAGQLTVYLLIGFAVLGIPELFGAWWLFLAVTGAAGVALGLAVSAIPGLSERAAVAFVPLLMIPQIILAGADPFPFSEMRHLRLRHAPDDPASPAPPPEIAQLLPARWAYEGLVALHRDHSFAGRYIRAGAAFDAKELVFFRRFPGDELKVSDPPAHQAAVAEFARGYAEKFGRPLTGETIARFHLKKAAEVPPQNRLRADDFVKDATKRFPRTHTWPGRANGVEVAVFDAAVLAGMTLLGLGTAWLLGRAALATPAGRPLRHRRLPMLSSSTEPHH